MELQSKFQLKQSNFCHSKKFLFVVKAAIVLFVKYSALSLNSAFDLLVTLFLCSIMLWQGSRWASPMSPFAIFNFIWQQNTALGDFFGDNILFIKNYFVLLSINGAGKKHRLLERAS